MQERNTEIVMALIVITAVAGGYAWTARWSTSDESDLAELTEIFVEGPPTPERGKEIDRVIDKYTAGMSEEQKDEFFLNTMLPIVVPIMAKRSSDEYDKLMAMSPEERNRELDRRIDKRAKDGGPFGGQSFEAVIGAHFCRQAVFGSGEFGASRHFHRGSSSFVVSFVVADRKGW